MGKGRLPRIILRDKTGKLLFEKKLTGLPLKEEAIIAGTVKYYDDPNPCIIRRSAVMRLFFTELSEILLPYTDKEAVAIETLPPRFNELTDFPPGTAILEIHQ
jgi:hypothetical protein